MQFKGDGIVNNKNQCENNNLYVPLRVDFAGGWLDVPHLSRADGYIINCAVSPLVSLTDWPYRKKSGLGGSGAWSILNGKNPVESELNLGAGWQDPAVIMETGACVWLSGKEPVLEFKNTGMFLKGKMAVLDTCLSHNTPSLTQNKRDYEKIVAASHIARQGVMHGSIQLLAQAIQKSLMIQIEEGMKPLPVIPNAIASKYCGGGFGGYALYLFESKQDRDKAVFLNENLIAIEPYCRSDK